ncbi:hypothetical protein DSECCO2_241350 [anaerobic digester metagenome]
MSSLIPLRTGCPELPVRPTESHCKNRPVPRFQRFLHGYAEALLVWLFPVHSAMPKSKLPRPRKSAAHLTQVRIGWHVPVVGCEIAVVKFADELVIHSPSLFWLHFKGNCRIAPVYKITVPARAAFCGNVPPVASKWPVPSAVACSFLGNTFASVPSLTAPAPSDLVSPR